MRQRIVEGISVASLLVSAIFGLVGVWGCPNAKWLHWTVLGFLMLGSVSGFVALGVARWSQRKGYTEIANQTYLGTDVLLDGHVYLACTFTNVTFVYNGGDSGGFDGHCLFGGSLGFVTGDPKLGQMLGFLREMKMLRPDAFAMYRPKARED
jgi:hypothetical protein